MGKEVLWRIKMREKNANGTRVLAKVAGVLLIASILTFFLFAGLHVRETKATGLNIETWSVQNDTEVSKFDFYLWNITNLDENMKLPRGREPKYEEIGPFCYWQHNERNYQQNNTKDYTSTALYTSRLCETNSSLDSPIVHLNIPFIVIHNLIDSMNELSKRSHKKLFAAVASWSLFANHTARDLIWGYEDAAWTKLVEKGLDLERLWSSDI